MCANSPIGFHHSGEPNSRRWPAFQQSEDGGDANGNASIDRTELGGNSLYEAASSKVSYQGRRCHWVHLPRTLERRSSSVADTSYTANRPQRSRLTCRRPAVTPFASDTTRELAAYKIANQIVKSPKRSVQTKLLGRHSDLGRAQSTHGLQAVVVRFYNSRSTGVPGSFSNFLGRAYQAYDGVIIWEDADDLGAPLNLAVEALDRVSRVQLGAVLLRESHVGQHVGLGVVHDCRQLRHLGPDLVGDGAPLYGRGLGRLLGEGGGDESRDDAAPALAGMRQHVPHEVDAAPLPCRAQHLGHGGLDALMGIGDDELDAAQAAAGQLAQELRPDRLGL